jgi:hypothetical protein
VVRDRSTLARRAAPSFLPPIIRWSPLAVKSLEQPGEPVPVKARRQRPGPSRRQREHPTTRPAVPLIGSRRLERAAAAATVPQRNALQRFRRTIDGRVSPRHGGRSRGASADRPRSPSARPGEMRPPPDRPGGAVDQPPPSRPRACAGAGRPPSRVVRVPAWSMPRLRCCRVSA